jgi:hypothetical protein
MAHDLPERWREPLHDYLRQSHGHERSGLSAYDFRADEGVRLRFHDGSSAHFRYAFFLRHPTLREVAVFTEHCGYHYFPDFDLEVAMARDPQPPSDD